MFKYLKGLFGEAFAMVIMGLVVIALIVVAGLAVNTFILNPYKQAGYNGQVQGLITDYCTSPQKADQEGARLQLRGLATGDPTRWSALPGQLSATADLVLQDNLAQACNP